MVLGEPWTNEEGHEVDDDDVSMPGRHLEPEGGNQRMDFGQYKGLTYTQVYIDHGDYIDWARKQKMPGVY